MTTPLNLHILRTIAEGACEPPTTAALVAHYRSFIRDVEHRIKGMRAGGLIKALRPDERLAVTKAGQRELDVEIQLHGFERPSRLPR